MANKKIIMDELQIPKGLNVSSENRVVNVSGPKGKVQKDLSLPNLKISIDGDKVKLEAPLRELNTALSHIKNMFKGCSEGFVKHMKVVYAHFPMSIAVSGKQVSIKNFTGEKKPRFSDIVGETKVDVKGANITISGANKEDVNQTVANLRRTTKIRNLDTRVFQDGIYPVE